MTFREAYIRTGRILNISVIPADRHSCVYRHLHKQTILTLVRPSKLLNYMTAPDTVIWTALLASAAVPGILNPVVLMQKLKDGSIVPWNWGSRFKDGSLRCGVTIDLSRPPKLMCFPESTYPFKHSIYISMVNNITNSSLATCNDDKFYSDAPRCVASQSPCPLIFLCPPRFSWQTSCS
jgi:hypothetical protein